ncbi:MAG: hypothetical protein EOP45_04205 [Sphingobacteriaceae bacterium]|nr:MAG: hypothetical protein EOP45_04205 [Sphingobacteriaceae bacterium]
MTGDPIELLKLEAQELIVQIKQLTLEYGSLDRSSVEAIAISTGIIALQTRYTQVLKLLI